MLIGPAELGESTPLLTAFDDYPETIFRLAGTINPGLHEFRIPIDSTVESVLFSVSVQCRIAPGVDRFRVMVEGRDAGGLPFQRVSAPLFAR